MKCEIFSGSIFYTSFWGGPFHVNDSHQPETFEVKDHCLFPGTAPKTFLKESQLQLAS